MTIDDELLIELLKPDTYGARAQVGKGALIINVVGTSNIQCKLEESEYYQTKADAAKRTWSIMTPDIIVTIPSEPRKIAIELENDIHWDFQQSLRQVKKYKNNFGDVRVIIPQKYIRFAPLYKNEGFRVYLWKAKRQWECLRCGTVTEKEGPIQPKCKNVKCKNKSRTEFTLIGLKGAEVYEYE